MFDVASSSEMPMSVRRICPKCGFPGCACGQELAPAWKRSADAIAANPDRSDRLIAREVGVSHTTVRRARKSLGTSVPPAKRVGKDGKKYCSRLRTGGAVTPSIKAALANPSRTIDSIAEEFGVTSAYVAKLSSAFSRRKGVSRKQAAKVLRSFNKAMDYIFNTCEHMSEVTIPPLGDSEKAAALKRLDETRSTLRKFSDRIREMHHE